MPREEISSLTTKNVELFRFAQRKINKLFSVSVFCWACKLNALGHEQILWSVKYNQVRQRTPVFKLDILLTNSQ